MTTPKRVFVVYHVIAHYRGPIMRALCSAGGALEYSVVAGNKPDIPALKVISAPEGARGVFSEGIRWFCVTNRWFFGKFLWQHGLIGTLASEQPDAVILLGVAHIPAFWAAMVYCKLTRTPIALWSHGFYGNERGVKRLVRTFFYSLADGLLLYGERGVAEARRRLKGQISIRAVYNSLDYERQARIRDSIGTEEIARFREGLGIAIGSRVIVFSGRLTKAKNLGMLIQALAMVRNSSCSSLIALFVGDGPMMPSLMATAAILGVSDAVLFLGAHYDEEYVAKVFLSSDVCVSPGNVGLTAIHAMTYGIPVVTHGSFERQGPEAEIIVDGVTGSFFIEGDVSDLAKKIEAWLLSPRNAELARTIVSGVETKWTPLVQSRIFRREIGRLLKISGDDSYLHNVWKTY